MHALAGKMLPCRLDVLGGDADAAAGAHRRRIIETGGRRHAHPAARDTQVEGLVETGAAVFEQHVPPGDAEIRGTVLDVGRRVGGTDDHQPDVGPVGADDELARTLRVLCGLDAGRRQQRQGFLEDAPFGQGDGDAGHGLAPRKCWNSSRQSARCRAVPARAARQPPRGQRTRETRAPSWLSFSPSFS